MNKSIKETHPSLVGFVKVKRGMFSEPVIRASQVQEYTRDVKIIEEAIQYIKNWNKHNYTNFTEDKTCEYAYALAIDQIVSFLNEKLLSKTTESKTTLIATFFGWEIFDNSSDEKIMGVVQPFVVIRVAHSDKENKSALRSGSAYGVDSIEEAKRLIYALCSWESKYQRQLPWGINPFDAVIDDELALEFIAKNMKIRGID